LLNLDEVIKWKGNCSMNVTEFQEWVKEYYQMRGWSDLDIFIRIGFLAEETGEVARAIRSLEIGRDRPDEGDGTLEEHKKELTEELGDVLGNLIVIANKYDIPLEEIFKSHKAKLSERYSN
jgi:NTP pyrophosphatase (non-canonical NTP hydrolase)